MKKALLLAGLLLTFAAGSANAELHPGLRPVRLTPPVFRGSGFHAHERVTISLLILPAATSFAVTNARGEFSARLAAVPACGGWMVRAVGSRGSRAAYRRPVCASATAGVEGIVLRGPTQPACVAGTPCDAPDAGVTVQALRGGNVVSETATDGAGRFTLSLPPGYYTIEALGRGTRPRQVHVTASTPVDVAFLVDTGIR